MKRSEMLYHIAAVIADNDLGYSTLDALPLAEKILRTQENLGMLPPEEEQVTCVFVNQWGSEDE